VQTPLSVCSHKTKRGQDGHEEISSAPVQHLGIVAQGMVKKKG